MRERSMTAQQRLRYARRALKQAATLIKEAASLGTMSDETRSLLGYHWAAAEDEAGAMGGLIGLVNQDQSALRAKRSRRAE